MNDLYQEHILDHFKHPRHKNKPEGVEITTQQANPSCGDSVIVYISLSPDKKYIKALGWQGEGCAISQSSMSVLSEHILDHKLTVQEILNLTEQTLLQLLGLEEVNPGREKCLLLGLQTLKKALYQSGIEVKV